MITAIIQARMNSSRLYGKVLREFSGNTLLGHIIERLKYSKYISEVIVATTDTEADDVLVSWLDSRSVKYYRGSENDVLDRYFEAASSANATNILRVTADDPFKDPQIIDQVVDLFFNQSLDFAYNNNPPSFAEGLDTEIFTFDALKKANRESQDDFEREHVTQFFYRNPDIFKQANFQNSFDYSYLRWTIDTEDDMEMTKIVYENLYNKNKIFLSSDILNFIEKRADVPEINLNVKRSAMYNK